MMAGDILQNGLRHRERRSVSVCLNSQCQVSVMSYASLTSAARDQHRDTGLDPLNLLPNHPAAFTGLDDDRIRLSSLRGTVSIRSAALCPQGKAYDHQQHVLYTVYLHELLYF